MGANVATLQDTLDHLTTELDRWFDSWQDYAPFINYRAINAAPETKIVDEDLPEF